MHKSINNDSSPNLQQISPSFDLRKIQKQRRLQDKIRSIESYSCDELQNELEKLHLEKQFEYSFLKQSHEYELDEADICYQHKIDELSNVYNKEQSNLSHHFINKLQRIKSRIQNYQKKIKHARTNRERKKLSLQKYSNTEIQNDINSISSTWNTPKYLTKCNVNLINKKRVTRHGRKWKTSKYHHVWPPKRCLDDDAIECDIKHLMQIAKERNIYIECESLSGHRKRRRNNYLNNNSNKNLMVNEEDMNEIKDICSKLGLTDNINRGLSVALYGYNNHLECYRDVFNLIKNNYNDERIQKQYIGKLKSNKLRDIKVKISSLGTTGRSKEMADGIIKKLKELNTNYLRMIQNR